jgi:hypothetical protein
MYEYDVPKRRGEREGILSGIAKKRHLFHPADIDPSVFYGAGRRADCPDGGRSYDIRNIAAAFDTIFTNIGEDE